MSKYWQTKAPANTMILGEHSVVYGHPAIACALNQFVTIKWHARTDKTLNIQSALGQHQTQIEQITLHPKLKFVIATLKIFQDKLPHGLDISIHSQFSSTIGLGSSAAILAAMLHGLNKICCTNFTHDRLFSLGHQVIIEIQGRGSGTDLAASLTGGWVYFQPQLIQDDNHTATKIEKLAFTDTLHTPALQLIYAGYKTPTAEVLELVAEQWANKPKQLEMLYRSMAKVTRSAYQNLLANEWEEFYQQVKNYQHLMVQLGVSDDTLGTIINAMHGCVELQAAKISGSGLGDCIIGIGNLNQCSNSSQHTLEKFKKIHIKVTELGASTQCLTASSVSS